MKNLFMDAEKFIKGSDEKIVEKPSKVKGK